MKRHFCSSLSHSTLGTSMVQNAKDTKTSNRYVPLYFTVQEQILTQKKVLYLECPLCLSVKGFVDLWTNGTQELTSWLQKHWHNHHICSGRIWQLHYQKKKANQDCSLATMTWGKYLKTDARALTSSSKINAKAPIPSSSQNQRHSTCCQLLEKRPQNTSLSTSKKQWALISRWTLASNAWSPP